jgi:serine/threonine-protein kinase RsbW
MTASLTCAKAKTMPVADACALPARMESLAEATGFVEAFCSERDVGQGDRLRLRLMVEELFTNTVIHGHGGGSDDPVRIGLRADPQRVELSYEDSAPPFDPLEYVARSPVDSTADVADRPVGQLGIALVVSMAERVSYVHEDGCNRLQLVLRRQVE